MKCRSALNLLPLHCSGDLEGARAKGLDAHLARCPDCASELRAHQRMTELLASVREPATPFPGLWEELDSRLDAVDAARRLRRPWTRNPWLYTSVAALLLLALLPWVPRVGSSSAVPARSAELAQVTPQPVAAPGGLHAVPGAQLRDFLGRNGALLLRRRAASPVDGMLVVPVVHSRRDF